jgi:hypothetical protein
MSGLFSGFVETEGILTKSKRFCSNREIFFLANSIAFSRRFVVFFPLKNEILQDYMPFPLTKEKIYNHDRCLTTGCFDVLQFFRYVLLRRIKC